MALPGSYFGAVVGLLVGAILQGRLFGYPTKAGYHDTDGELMSKEDAVADQALLMIGTTVAGYIIGPSLLALVEANPLLGMLAAGFVIYLALHEDIEQWKLT
jgi:hypothetical protein